MTENFIKRIIEHRNPQNGKRPEPVYNSQPAKPSGYFMMQATTAVDEHKFKTFYAVPEFMREATNKDKSVLEKSTNIRNLYEVDMGEYQKNPKTHNKNAERKFSSFTEDSQLHAEQVKYVSKLLNEQSLEQQSHQVK